MADYVGLVADIALAVVAFAGTYYASGARRLFKGDIIMERVWLLATAAFTLVALLSLLDFIFTVENSSLVLLHLTRIGAVLAMAVFVVATMLLVRWGKTSTEQRTRQ
jgi:hypothetical protein